MIAPADSRLLAARALAALALLGLACGGPDHVGPDSSQPSFAKAAGPTVTSTSPDSGAQGTVSLDVQVFGSGFDQGSKAAWDSAGAPYPKIAVNSTKFVNPNQLLANITIASDAAITLYDVAVTTSTGRKGVGTELFAVTAPNGNHPEITDPRANLVLADSVDIGTTAPHWVPAGIRGDGRLKDGTVATGTPSNEYQGHLCGVSGYLAAATNESGELILDPGAGDSVCAARSFNFYLSADSTHLNPVAFPNSPVSHARGLWNVGPAGASVTQFEGFGPMQSNCPILMFNDAFPPANSLRYTRLSDSTTPSGPVRRWRIASQGSHMAACVSMGNKAGTYVPNGIYYFVPFVLTVTEVPYPYPTYP